MDKMPNKFEFCTKYNRADKHVLEYFEEGMYRYLNEDGSHGPHYTAAFVKSCLNEGSWIMTKDLDEKPAVEPELNLPFNFVCPEELEIRTYTATDGGDGLVNVDWKNNTYGIVRYKENDVKENIKAGHWVVTSVTGKKTPEQPEVLIEAGSIKTDSLSITVDCNTDQAVANMERLMQAIENVNIAMESFIALQKEMKGVL